MSSVHESPDGMTVKRWLIGSRLELHNGQRMFSSRLNGGSSCTNTVLMEH